MPGALLEPQGMQALPIIPEPTIYWFSVVAARLFGKLSRRFQHGKAGSHV